MYSKVTLVYISKIKKKKRLITLVGFIYVNNLHIHYTLIYQHKQSTFFQKTFFLESFLRTNLKNKISPC